tara:strand:+ start:1289 stop:1630 length:342 start_codon:yes stop_codon:yes gene_type:complete
MKVEIDKILDVIDSYITQFIDENKEEGTGLLHKDIDKELYKESRKFDDCVEQRPIIEIDVDNNICCRQTTKLPIDNVFTEVVDYIVYNTHGSRKLFLLMLIECLVEERGFYKQ